MINIFNYLGETKLTNIISGHHSSEALSVEEFEKINGALPLNYDDIKHNILVIKINQLYRRDITGDELYDAVRGGWRADKKKAQSVDYVFGVYNSLIVAVYKPTQWYKYKEAPEKRPRPDAELTSKIEDRIFFVDDNFKNGISPDENQNFYLHKSISNFN